MGPVLMFDKSTLHGLSVDEAVWLDTFYYPNITPLFFVETLADLEKEVRGGRTPEDVVGNLAEKTPVVSGGANVPHRRLCAANLLGHPVQMEQRIILGGARHVVSGARKGVIIQPPERQALERWQKREFLAVERDFAQQWRRTLSEVDLTRTAARPFGGAKLRDLAAAKEAAEETVRRDGDRYRNLRMALDRFGIPEPLRGDIIQRWKAEGGPHLVDFAPYAAYVTTVDTFFAFATGAGLESTERPSHRIDLAYLYYLPFCSVFSSGDGFHARLAPLFLTPDQVFVSAADLKADLAKLDAHYSELPQEVKVTGVVEFAFYPPTQGDFLVSRLWDRFMHPKWRERAESRVERPKLTEEQQRELVERLKELRRDGSPSAPFDSDQADEVQIRRRVPPRRGKWQLLSDEVLRRARERADEDD